MTLRVSCQKKSNILSISCTVYRFDLLVYKKKKKKIPRSIAFLNKFAVNWQGNYFQIVGFIDELSRTLNGWYLWKVGY